MSRPWPACARPCLKTVVEGINTNIPLHQELMVDASFVEGGTNIHYLEAAGAAQESAESQLPPSMLASGHGGQHVFN